MPSQCARTGAPVTRPGASEQEQRSWDGGDAQQDDVGMKLVNAKWAKQLMHSRANQLGVSAGPDPDSVYVGKSYTNHNAGGNYWNIYVGDYLPGTLAATNAFWDFDNSVGIQAPDSLHGWWPLRRQYNSTGGLTLLDDQRPWWALDHGNMGNYVISQQVASARNPTVRWPLYQSVLRFTIATVHYCYSFTPSVRI